MNNAFHDYSTREGLLEIEPPENEMYYCRENEGVLLPVASWPSLLSPKLTLVRLEISHVKKSYFSPYMIHRCSSRALAPITLLNEQKLPSNGPEGQ